MLESGGGNPHVLLLPAAAGGVWRARGDHRTHSVERGQAPGDVRHDGVLGAVGAATELAGDSAGVWDQLGGGVSLGGMASGVGLGPPGVARGGVDRRGRDSLGPWFASEQLPDRDLPDRRALPAPAVGGKTAVSGDTAARAEGTGSGGGERIALCVQRHVDALPESAGGRGRASVAGVGPFPHYDAFESGGGSGAAWRKHTLAGGEPAEGAAPQAHALAATAPGQPSPRAGAKEAPRSAGQQAGHGPGLGVEGNLLPFLGLQIRDLGESLS